MRVESSESWETSVGAISVGGHREFGQDHSVVMARDSIDLPSARLPGVQGTTKEGGGPVVLWLVAGLRRCVMVNAASRARLHEVCSSMCESQQYLVGFSRHYSWPTRASWLSLY